MVLREGEKKDRGNERKKNNKNVQGGYKHVLLKEPPRGIENITPGKRWRCGERKTHLLAGREWLKAEAGGCLLVEGRAKGKASVPGAEKAARVKKGGFIA